MTTDTATELQMDWTGHHLVDMGIATLCAMAEKDSPRDLSMGDLDRAADEMNRWYFDSFLISYFSCVFTLNAYHNPSSGDGKKKEYARTVLWAHRNTGDGKAGNYTCPFSGKTATHFIDRRHMPLLAGDSVLNFYPDGLGSLPIYGPYLTALQALPMGARRAQGRLFAVYGDDPYLTIAIASKYLADNRRILALAVDSNLPEAEGPHPDLIREAASYDKSKKKPKYCDVKYPNTLLMNDLMEVNIERSKRISSKISITAYWLSNSGQGPTLDLIYYPSGLIRFLQKARIKAGDEWNRLINKGWNYYKKSDKKPDTLTGPGRTGNRVFEDLAEIFKDGFLSIEKARLFIKRHLLGNVADKINLIKEGKIDPDSCESFIMWDLTELFLTEVTGMNGTHVDSIKEFADKLAVFINDRNDRQLFRSVVYSKKPWDLRNELVKAQRNAAKDKNSLLFSFQEYIDVFLADEAVGQIDWRLTGDLISIRLIETLFKNGYFDKNPDLLVEDSEKTE